jgi:trimethylamine--corrinoid protein Co-methyltransferase
MMPRNLNPKRIGLPASLYRPLSEADVEKVIASALRVLAESGMMVYSPKAFEAFRQAGAEVDAETRIVRLPRSLVEDAIAANPSSITLYSRNGENDVVLERNKVHYGTGGTAIFVLDPDTGRRRPSTTADVILNARMVEALDNIHLFTINVFPNDIPAKDEIDINRFFHSLDNTRKHVMGGIYSPAGLRQVVDMAEGIAGGPDALGRRPFVSFITLIISPFKIDRDYGDMTCFLAEKGLPVVVPTEPICGTTSPITLAGNVLTHVAETLGGVCLVQCVRRGAPAVSGSVGSIPDLRTLGHLGGPVERAMINAAVAQVMQRLEVPLYSTGGTTDAKTLDVQCAYESALSNLLVAMSGANYIHDAAGLMEFDLTVSYDKLVVDDEILGMVQRVLRGIEVTDDTLAADLMIEKGPGRDFLAEDHTIRYMRKEFFFPVIADRDKRESIPAPVNALGKARRIVDAVRGAAPRSCLDPAARERILKAFPAIRL